MKLTQDTLKKYLHYNPETGIFTWKVNRSNIKQGDIAGFVSERGYVKIKFFKKSWPAHRLAFLYMEGYIPEYCVDHIDRNPGNNKWNNLREASFLCNTRNQKVAKNNKSGIAGVNFHKGIGKWQADISLLQKKIYLGVYADFSEAAMARWKAEVKLGYPTCNSNSSAYLYLKEHGLLPKDDEYLGEL